MSTNRSPFLRFAYWALLPLLAMPFPAWSWNAAGHRLVACIAWDHLAVHSRSSITQLLREHPDYERWNAKSRADDAGRGAFIEASTWPDDIRKDSRFYTAGLDEPTTLLPGFPTMERHAHWHYVNRPIDGSPAGWSRREPASGLLDKELAALAETAGSSSTPKNERIYALPWLIHLTGDAHQPLHASIRLIAEGRWGKFGDEMMVSNPFNPRKPSSTLHAFWDDLPGPPWLRGERLDIACRALVASHPHRPPPGSSGQWIDESWQIARQSGYPESQEAFPTIDEPFFLASRKIANRRIAEAGYRLAEWLNALFPSSNLGLP